MSKSSLKVAILLATYNGEKYLEEQLRSILNQKDVEIYIFISDDGSTDTTLKIIRKYADQYPNIIISNEQRVGGPAKNFYQLIKTINVKDYDYIALTDQDDLWPEYRLSRAIDQLKFHQADAYSSDVIAVDDQAEIKKNNRYLVKRYDIGSIKEQANTYFSDKKFIDNKLFSMGFFGFHKSAANLMMEWLCHNEKFSLKSFL